MKDKLPRVPLGFKSVGEMLSINVQKYPDKEAIVAYDVDTNQELRIKYYELRELVFKTANFLISIGIKSGDRYAILMHNCPEILIFELAGALIGAATVPLDYKRDLLERKIFKLKETGARAMFVKWEEGGGKLDKEAGSGKRDKNEEIRKILPGLAIAEWGSWGEFKRIINKNISSVSSSHEVFFRDAKRPTSLNESLPPTSDQDSEVNTRQTFSALQKTHASRIKNDNSLNSTYIVLYTSGTTAHPKGAILTQRACFLNAAGIADWQKLDEKDRFQIVMPLHHINSTIFSLATLIKGGTIILVTRYTASKFWEIAARFGVTNTSIVPTILHDQLGKVTEFEKVKGNIKLKRICIGSAPVLPSETLAFFEKYKIRVVQGYGQTETALRVAGVPADLSEKEYLETVKTNTIGKELANNRLAIMDGNNNWKKENEEGEICIAGPVLADGYLNDKKATREAFIDGWFHSGDLGKYKIINGEKYFYIIGRIKEIIIKGGVNLSPSAIEDAILKNLPEVEECCVIGLPDERMGEEVGVAIRMKNYELRIMNEMKNKIMRRIKNKAIEGLSEYEMPKRVFFMDALPKTSTGKIQRVEAKRMVSKEFAEVGGNAGPAARVSQDSLQVHREMNSSYKSSYSRSDGGARLGKPSLASPVIIKQIKYDEKEVLKKAAHIETERFGLATSYEQFKKRAKNGVVWGIFGKEGELVGSLSCLRMNLKDLEKVNSWKEVTGNGRLGNNNFQGDTLVCVAISVNKKAGPAARVSQDSLQVHREMNSSYKSSYSRSDGGARLGKPSLASPAMIKNYIKSGRDHVLVFHARPKGGIAGARVWKILANGRPEDTEAMGYNVLMRYPDISEKTKIKINSHARPSTLLIEKALEYAARNGIKHVVAFSRPAGLKDFLKGVIYYGRT